MKKKIIFITAVLLITGAIVFAYDSFILSPQQTAEHAVANSKQVEIDKLMMQLNQISYEDSLKASKITPVNNYQGQITKHVTPFEKQTTYMVSQMKNERTLKQTELDVLTAAISLYSNQLAHEDAKIAYEKAHNEYMGAINDKSSARNVILNLEYAAESKRISLKQAENNLNATQRAMDNLTGLNNVQVSIPEKYSNPYNIDPAKAIESKLDTDINLYKAQRELTSAQKRLDIADKFFDKEDDVYIKSLVAYHSADLNLYETIREIEVSVYNDIDSLKNKYDAIELEILNNKIKKESYDSALRQYNAGIISRSIFENHESAYNSAKGQLKSKIYDFIVTSLKFEIETNFSFTQ